MSRYLPFVPLLGDVGKQQMQPVFIDDVGRAVAEALENRPRTTKPTRLAAWR